MKWLKLNKEESEAIFFQWQIMPEPEYDISYEKLRNDIVRIFEDSKNYFKLTDFDIAKKGYSFDLRFGSQLYELLSSNYNLNLRNAADDGIWRYLSLKVAPDLIFHRWGLRPERYWSRGRRGWFKTLWWYIHLSHQGTIERTYRVLESNTADEIVQLVERAGAYGYRVGLYREIMKQYSPIANERKDSSSLFRKIMKLNTARCKMVEPELAFGGVETYVRELFDYFETTK